MKVRVATIASVCSLLVVGSAAAMVNAVVLRAAAPAPTSAAPPADALTAPVSTTSVVPTNAVEVTDNYRTWWSYIPHFINTPGYVYAYAYGQLLALSVYKRYEERGADFVPAYLELLAAGGSKSPEELGKIVDCDLASVKVGIRSRMAGSRSPDARPGQRQPRRRSRPRARSTSVPPRTCAPACCTRTPRCW